MQIALDWPSQPLWPNRKAHWTKNKTARDLQREAAFYLAKQAGLGKPPFGAHEVRVSMTFCGPTKTSRFDLDGALSAMKGAIDGLSACLSVDDSLFSYTLRRGEKCKNGAVLVTVEVA